ncbi:MAG TPA: hypothetical protein P5250_07510 [Bacteroidales bacterium]|nr:hypothetical protein [Bacteroidales bacterium]
MKKIVFILISVCVISLIASSCKTHERCDAYKSQNIENNKHNNPS